MATEPEPLDGVWNEEHSVFAWRYGTLVEAGYPPNDALEIAFAFEIDLHAACDLLKAGCDPETARNILL